MTPKKRGRKRKQTNPLIKRVTKLEKENRRLQDKLKKAETIIEVQNNFRVPGGSTRIRTTAKGAADEFCLISLSHDVDKMPACEAL
jgi:hypothetical protein